MNQLGKRAYVDLKSVNMEPLINNVSSENLKSDAIFEYIIDQVKTNPNKAKGVGGLFMYVITKNGQDVKKWTMDLKNAKVFQGTPDGKPDTTITVSDDDFMLMAQGKLTPQVAFMKGKVKVTGNIMLAQKLTPLLKAAPKL